MFIVMLYNLLGIKNKALPSKFSNLIVLG